MVVAKPRSCRFRAAVCLGVIMLTGCARAGSSMKATEIRCVPRPVGDGWRIDAYIRIEARNETPERWTIELPRFILGTTAGEVAADPTISPDPGGRDLDSIIDDSWRSFRGPVPPAVVDIEPHDSAIFELCFPGMAASGPAGETPAERSATRRAWIDTLAKVQPSLEYRGERDAIAIDLDRLVTLPDKLPTHASRYADKVTVVELPGGLCGFNLAALEQRLVEPPFEAGRRYVLQVGNEADPCFHEWWQPATTPMIGATIEVALSGRPFHPTADFRWKGLPYRLYIRNVRLAVTRDRLTPVYTSEPHAVHALAAPDERRSLLRDWLRRDDPEALVVALQHLEGDPEYLADVIRLLRHGPTKQIRDVALQALREFRAGTLGDQRDAVARALVEAAERDPQSTWPLAIAGPLGCLDAVLPFSETALTQDKGPSNVFASLIQSGGAAGREAVWRRLRERHDPAAAEALFSAEDPQVLAYLRSAIPADLTAGQGLLVPLLGAHGNDSDGALLASLWNDELWQTGAGDAMIRAMGELGGPEAFECLLRIADTGEPIRNHTLPSINRTRWRALDALRRFRGDRAVPVWERMAIDYQCTETCIAGLVGRESPAGLAALQRLAELPDEYVAEQARSALAGIAKRGP